MGHFSEFKDGSTRDNRIWLLKHFTKQERCTQLSTLDTGSFGEMCSKSKDTSTDAQDVRREKYGSCDKRLRQICITAKDKLQQ